MRERTAPSAPATLLAAIVLMVACVIFGANELRAQCNSVTVTNNTECPFTICAGPPSNRTCFPIPANGSTIISIPANVQLSGIINACNKFIRFPNTGCIDQTQIGPTCCVKICLDRVACTVTVTKVANQCPC